MFACRLPGCEGFATRTGVMCGRHTRVVPLVLKMKIRRMIGLTQVDPRGNPNATKAWKILGCQASIFVLRSQGKKDALGDEVSRLLLLEKR